MNPKRSQPITFNAQDRLRAWASALTGRRIVGARYRSVPGSGWLDERSAKSMHEVDMDVRLLLDDGTSAVVSWAMAGLVEGIDLRIEQNRDDDEIDVTDTPEWRSFVDHVIEGVAAAWHVPNEGCPDTLWAVRLSLSERCAIAVGLGRVEADVAQYQPDALVVLFGETAARAYRPPASGATAFGTPINPS